MADVHDERAGAGGLAHAERHLDGLGELPVVGRGERRVAVGERLVQGLADRGFGRELLEGVFGVRRFSPFAAAQMT